MAGRIDFCHCPNSTAIPLIRDGRLLALAATIPTPFPGKATGRFAMHRYPVDSISRKH